MKIHSDLIPSPVPGYVMINGERFEAAWVLDVYAFADTGRADIHIVDVVKFSVNGLLGEDAVKIELLRGENLIASGEAFLDGVFGGNKLQLTAMFRSLELGSQPRGDGNEL